jgi:hypothetical protein
MSLFAAVVPCVPEEWHFPRSVSPLGRPDRLVLHSFVLGREPSLRRFNGIGLGFLDRVALGRAAQRRNDDGECTRSVRRVP